MKKEFTENSSVELNHKFTFLFAYESIKKESGVTLAKWVIK